MKYYILESYRCNVRKFIFITLLLISLPFTSGGNTKWCWTQSMVNEPSFVLDAKKGGMNWGYCVDKADVPEFKYMALVETSSLSGSATKSAIKVKLYGNNGVSEVVDFWNYGFERGFIKKVNFTAKDVGELQKLRLILDGNQRYRCKNIQLFAGTKKYTFQCLRALTACTPTEPTKCFLDMEVDGPISYKVTITAEDKPKDGTNSPIFFTIIGGKGKGQKKLFSEKGLEASKTDSLTFNSNDIGDISGFALEIEENGRFKPKEIPGKNPVNYDSAKSGATATTGEVFSPGGSRPKPADGELPPVKGLDVNNTNGGLVSIAEKSDIIDIDCTQTLENPDENTNIFGPEYPTKNVNYLRVLVRCPASCHKSSNSIVYGAGIHPQITPICLAAIVDNAMSLYGGIISISIFAAYKQYTIPKDFPEKVHGINVKAYMAGDAKKSYVLAKIDNIDFVEKDIRIVNEKGELSSQGRLEMRYEGVWGTICMLGNDKKSAKVICKEIGYKDGEWLNPSGQDGKNFCRSFNGEDYCGAKTSKLFLSAIKCDEGDNVFKKCEKELSDPDKCGHDYDSIISCYNNDYTKPVEIPSKTVKLEAYRSEGDVVTGRLEMYSKNKWNPVCNIGFAFGSAFVACKAMGYEKGQLYFDKSISKFQLGSDSKRPFSATKVMCKGKEKSFEKCPMKLDQISCKHDQDVVLVCKGKKGDPSGRSQYIKKIPQPPPKLGKLKIPFRNVNCATKGSHTIFRGDPGSIYLVSCPANCDHQPGSIWGIGVYSSDSNVCKAAIHAGVIGTVGGTFAYIKTFAQKKYTKGNQHELFSSISSIQWPQSFSVSQVNSGWVNSNNLLKKQLSSFIQRESADIKLINHWLSPLRVNTQIEENEGYNHYYVLNLHKKLMQYSSFLDVEAKKIPDAVLEWTRPSFTFKFTSKSQIQVKTHKIESLLQDYTLILQFKLMDFADEDTFLFSYGGGEGFNIVITKSGALALGDPSQASKFWNTGFRIALNDVTTIYLRYKLPTISILAISEKAKLPFMKSINLDMKLDYKSFDKIYMGRSAIEDVGHFIGEIKFIRIFAGDFAKKEVNKLISSITIKQETVSSSLNKTVDKRQCVSSCSENPVPPNVGCGTPPPEANINGPSLEEAGKSGESEKPLSKPGESGKPGDESSVNKPASPVSIIPGSTGTYSESEKTNIETIDLKCGTNLLDRRFTGNPGKIFRAKCPNCWNDKTMIFGTAIFHPRSSICRAALHTGVILKDKPGEIYVTLTGPKPIFNGSIGRNDINSGTFSKAKSSFFVTKAEKLTKVSCLTAPNMLKFAIAPVKSTFVVLCPKNCSEGKVRVYGTYFYTDYSSICMAAIHHGIINDKGGEVKFMIDGSKPQFKGSMGFGIETLDATAHIRSFLFLGNRASLYYSYTEDCEGLLQTKWKVEKASLGAEKSISDLWSFVNSMTTDDKKLTQFTGIKHEGKMILKGQKNKFSSWIFLKNAEWANGSVKFNILFKDLNPIAFFFRYKDQDNYYALQFLPAKKFFNINILRVLEGKLQVIDAKFHPLFKDKWYRIQVEYNFEIVKVFIQTEQIREHKVLFNRKLKGLHRGTIGFATNGNSKFFIGGVKIEKTFKSLKVPEESNTYTWKSVLANTSVKDRDTFCRSVFLDDQTEVTRCKNPHAYCAYKCSDKIPDIQNIWKYHCFTDCTKKIKNQNKPKKVYPQKSFIWQPVERDKCDYKPSGETLYVPCSVDSLSKIGNKKFATISYKTYSGQDRSVHIQYPDINFMKCGDGIPVRRDCKM